MPDVVTLLGEHVSEAAYREDLAEARHAQTVIQDTLAEHNYLQSAIGYPHDYWNQLNVYRGFIAKYGNR